MLSSTWLLDKWYVFKWNPDCQIWLDSYKEEYGSLLSNNTLDIISKDETQAKSHDIFFDNFDPSPWT